MNSMGLEWAAWTGPYQFGFGLACFFVGLALLAYSIGVDRLFGFNLPKPDASAADAIALLTTGDRRSFGEIWLATGEGALSRGYDQFHQLARDGKITVWGRKSREHPREPIPRRHWSTHQIDWLRLCRGEETTVSIKRDGSGPIYGGLEVNKKQARKVARPRR